MQSFPEQTVLALPEKTICISSNEQNPSVVPCLVTWHSGCSQTWDEQEKKKKKKTSRKICKWKDHLGSPICNLKGRKQILLVTKRRDILSFLSFFPKNLIDL